MRNSRGTVPKCRSHRVKMWYRRRGKKADKIFARAEAQLRTSYTSLDLRGKLV